MNNSVQTRVRQPLGLIEVIDRSEPAMEAHPDTEFIRDGHGLLYRGSANVAGEIVRGGAYSLFTRIWLGLSPPTGREPGYCAVVGEVWESGLDRFESLQARLRPVFLLDEVSDYILPRLLRNVANLKDIYCPYVDRSDLASERRRHDPFYQLLIWPQEELLEDVQKQHHGITCYPYEDDLNDSQCKQRWPWFRSRYHVIPAVFPPYKEDPERLYALVDALMGEKTDQGLEMFGAHELCKEWATGQHQTPHKAVSMVAAAFQRWDWSERVNVEALERDYPLPDEEEEWEEWMERTQADEEIEAVLYTVMDGPARSAIEQEGMRGYRRLIGLPEDPSPAERDERERADWPGAEGAARREIVVPM